jgi:DNA replication protein DnaC
LKNFDSFRYWNEAQLLESVRNSIGESKGDYLRHLSYLIDDQLLILDDIGSQKINEWKEEIIFDVIDKRYNSRLPTIITSNFNKTEFEKKYHPRLASRLFASKNIVIEIHKGVDLRQQ